MSVSVNPPKTPVTEGSSGVAAATVPNICKMPGPPAPFVPTPLPNIGKSGMSPKDYSQTVTIEGMKVAIKGATFKSMGDVASKGLGGGMVSMNCEGPTAFVGPGSMDVKIEGKNVQYLGDPMLNNCGPSGSPPNAATMQGVIQVSGMVTPVMAGPCPICEREHGPLRETKATKASASALAKAYEAEKGDSTMLAVAHCKTCSLKYADRSGTTDERFCRAADKSGFRHKDVAAIRAVAAAKGVDEPLRATKLLQEPFRSLLGAHFEALWAEGERLNQDFLGDTQNKPAAYAPGNCGGQKVVVLLLGNGGLPGAMTEQFYSKKGGEAKMGGQILHFDRKRGMRRPHQRPFKHGETTPPCKTCTLILPYLLCIEDKTKCSDK